MAVPPEIYLQFPTVPKFDSRHMLKEDLNDSDERKKLKTYFTGMLENKRKQQTDPIIYPDNKVSQRVLELLQSCAKEGGKRRINQMLEQGFFCMGKCELKCHCGKGEIQRQSFLSMT